MKPIHLLISVLVLLFGLNVKGQGSETFTNMSTGASSYGTVNFTGDNGQTWAATDSRTDQTITSNAITIRNGGLTFGLTTAQKSAGIGSLTLNAKAPFGSPDIGVLNLVINGSSVGTITTTGATTSSVVSYTWPGINIANITSIVLNQTSTGDRITIDDISWTASCSPPTTQASSINVSPITNISATVSWTNGSGTNRLVLLTTGGTPTGIPVNGTAYSANASYSAATTLTPGTGKIIYSNTGSSVNITGLANNTVYYGIIYEYNNASKCYMNTGVAFNFTTVSKLSDVVTAAGESSCISSILNGSITTSTDGTQVWQFTIRDGGASAPDADALPTIVNSIVITQGASNTVSDWTNIQSAALFNGTTLIANATISSTNLTFTGSPLITVADDNIATLSLRITLKASVSIPATIDGKIFRFSITAGNLTVASSGTSGNNTSALVATTNVTKDKVCVVATQLVYSTQPSNTGQNLDMIPAVVVNAYDANNNSDLDFSQSVTLTSTGTMTTGGSTTAISGVATFPGIKHSVIQSGLTLTATSSGVTSAISGTFDIVVSTAFAPGDFAILAVNTDLDAPDNGSDQITFIAFKPITTGTVFYMTDCGYEYANAGQWGTTEGVIKLTYSSASSLPAGTILNVTGSGTNNATITVNDCNNAAAAGWTVSKTGNVSPNGVGSFDLNNSDQVWFTQGGSWNYTTANGPNTMTYTGGNVLYGWSGIPWKTTPGYASTMGSTMYPNMNCFTTLTSGSGYFKYTGTTGPATRLSYISSINTNTNWTNYTMSALFYSASRSYTDGTNCTWTVNTATEQDGLWTGTRSTDWFDCNNWDTRSVPNATTNVTITSTATNNCLVAQSSSYAYLYNNTADCLDLTVDTKTLSTGASADIINVNGDFVLQNSATLDMTNGGTFNLLNGSWTNNSSTFISGTGTVVYGSSDIQTIAAENYNNLISGSTGDRILSTANEIGIKNILTPGSNIYTVTGSTIDFNGSGAQNIPALVTLNSSPYTNQYDVLKTSNGGIKTVTGDFTILDSLVVGTGSTFDLGNTSNIVTIKSDINNTARVATLLGTAAITYSGSSTPATMGKFNIERYIPMATPYTSRRWRLLTVPLKSENAPTINASWQEGQVSTDRTNPVLGPLGLGYGTSITNTTTSANGFDQGSTDNPSIYYLNNSGLWKTPLSTDGSLGSTAITDYPAYMLFVRGDRSIITSTAYITTSVTNLRSQGEINSGPVATALTSTAGQIQIIGNPYPSAISMNAVSMNGTVFGSSIGPTYYLWDPKTVGSKNVGGWVTFTSMGGNNYLIAPTAVSLYLNSPATNMSGIIESGDAFLIKSPGTGSIIFNETDKLTTNTTIGISSRPDTPYINNFASLNTDLVYVYPDGTTAVSDGVAVAYSNEMNNKVDHQDAPKLKTFSLAEKISLDREDSLLSIECRHTIDDDDTLFYRIDKLNIPAAYQLNFYGNNFDPKLIPILEDGFKSTSTLINMASDKYPFITTADTASTNPNRFKLVFKSIAKGIKINAQQQNENVSINWSVADESYINSYQIERSDDSINFNTIATKTVNGDLNYQLVDVKPASGKYYYYRVKALGVNNSYQYSDIIKVLLMFTIGSPQMYVFPNPVTDGVIGLQFNSEPAGVYQIKLVNNLGQVLLRKTINHTGGTASYVVSPGASNLVSTNDYHLEVTSSGMAKTICNFILAQ